MDHILDNMIWNAITTGNNDIAIINGDVGYYLPDIAPFAGMKIFTDANLKKLCEFIPANGSVAISSLHKMDHDESRWKLLQPMDVTQMVYEHSVNIFTTKNSHLIVPLSEGHLPQMMELLHSQDRAHFYNKPSGSRIISAFLSGTGWLQCQGSVCIPYPIWK